MYDIDDQTQVAKLQRGAVWAIWEKGVFPISLSWTSIPPFQKNCSDYYRTIPYYTMVRVLTKKILRAKLLVSTFHFDALSSPFRIF